MDDKPRSAACERNREPILRVLAPFFADRTRVLEIGSGTGQHAVHFAAAMPTLEWQASDREEHLACIEAWRRDARLPNLPPPLRLDVEADAWPDARYDAIYSSNTLHIMAWHEVESTFERIGQVATGDAKLAIYGPFNVDGAFTSDSNAAFDATLRERAPHMGLRDVADVDALAAAAGFVLHEDVTMPANNRLLLWRRQR